MLPRRHAFLAAAAALLAVTPPSRAGDHLFVVTSDGITGGAGDTAALDLLPPWTATTHLEPVGAPATVRHALGLHWVVNASPGDDVQAIDPATFETVRRFPAGAGSNPRDIAVVHAGSSWVSRYDSRWLLEIDPATGAPLDSVDLGVFADEDGLPEMAWVAVDGDRLFVQVQRIDRLSSGTTVPPALLAVVDLGTGDLIDVDAAREGIQGIELLGPVPQGRMQIEGRSLFVATPGGFLDVRGGIEEIDLDTFAHLGFLASEEDWAIDFGAFVLVSPTRGYVVNHTDFALSSHLHSFSRPDGAFLAEHFVTFSMVENLAYDAVTDQLFFPDPESGVRVFRGATGEALGGPVAAGGPPRDLIVHRAGTASTPEPPWRPAIVLAPNPSVSKTQVIVTVSPAGARRVTIHDVAGRLVRRLGQTGPFVRTTLEWDGRDEAGCRVASGTYVVHVEGGATGSRLLVRLR